MTTEPETVQHEPPSLYEAIVNLIVELYRGDDKMISDVQLLVDVYFPEPQLKTRMVRMLHSWNRAEDLMARLSNEELHAILGHPVDRQKLRLFLGRLDNDLYAFAGEARYDALLECKEAEICETPLELGFLLWADLKAEAYLEFAAIVMGICREVEDTFHQDLPSRLGLFVAGQTMRWQSGVLHGDRAKYPEEREALMALAAYAVYPDASTNTSLINELISRAMHVSGLRLAASFNPYLADFERAAREEWFKLQNQEAVKVRVGWFDKAVQAGGYKRKITFQVQPLYLKAGEDLYKERFPTPFLEVPERYWKRAVMKDDSFPSDILAGDIPLVPIHPRSLFLKMQGKQVPILGIYSPFGGGKSVILDSLAAWSIDRGYVVLRLSVPRDQGLNVMMPLMPYERRDWNYLTKQLHIWARAYPAKFITVAQNDSDLDQSSAYTRNDVIIFVEDLENFTLPWKQLLAGFPSGYLMARQLRDPARTNVMHAQLIQDFFRYRLNDRSRNIRLQADEIQRLFSAVMKSSEEAKVVASLQTNLADIRGLNLPFDWASLPYDEPIIAEVDGRIGIVKIGELVEEQLQTGRLVLILNGVATNRGIRIVRVPAFDPSTLKISMQEATGFIKHENRRVYSVKLGLGRTIRVSQDHSLFTLTSSGDVIPKRVDELKKRDFIAIPNRLPLPESSPSVINIGKLFADNLRAKQLDSFFVQKAVMQKIAPNSQGVSRARREYPTLASLVAHSGKAKLTDKLMRETRIHAFNSPWSSAIQGLIEMTEEVYEFLGLCLADGNLCWYPKRGHFGMEITCGLHERGYLEEANRACMKAFGIAGHIYKDKRENALKLSLSSKPFALFLRLIGLEIPNGRKSVKHIPPIVFGASRVCVSKFLYGFWKGDGTKRPVRQCVEIDSANLSMANELLALFLKLGIRTSLFHVKKNRTPFGDYYHLHAERASFDGHGMIHQHESSKDVIPTNLRSGRHAVSKRVFRQHFPDSSIGNADIMWVRVQGITEEEYRGPVYDLEIRPNGREIQNFVGGIGHVYTHNTQRPASLQPESLEMLSTFMFGELRESGAERSQSSRGRVLEAIRARMSDREKAFLPLIEKIMGNIPLSEHRLFFMLDHTMKFRLVRAMLPPHSLEHPNVDPKRHIQRFEEETHQSILRTLNEVERIPLSKSSEDSKKSESEDDLF